MQKLGCKARKVCRCVEERPLMLIVSPVPTISRNNALRAAFQTGETSNKAEIVDGMNSNLKNYASLSELIAVAVRLQTSLLSVGAEPIEP
tara:strand:- start:960 stop:1229 length:270 start_codon:yes stop_codon:yes gene_type:complete